MNFSEMHNADTDAVLGRISSAVGVSTDSELARALGVNRQTLGSWRQRGSVPYALCVELAATRGWSLDWLLIGRGSLTDQSAVDGGHGKEEDPVDDDPRLAAIVAWLRTWWVSAEPDERAWLVVELRRTFPEIGEWIKTRAPP